MSHDHRRGDHAGSGVADAAREPVRDAGPSADDDGHRGGWAAVWNAITAGIATVAGLAPHVLHHIGLLAGAFLITGVAGNLLFGVLGLALSIPLLRRLYRRFGTWKAPAIAVAVFTLMFSLSAFVIGPAISGTDEPLAPAPSQDISPSEHPEHHD